MCRTQRIPLTIGIGLPTVPVATVIGITSPAIAAVTYAVLPSGVKAMPPDADVPPGRTIAAPTHGGASVTSTEEEAVNTTVRVREKLANLADAAEKVAKAVREAA